jgi:hypothetical protein
MLKVLRTIFRAKKLKDVTGYRGHACLYETNDKTRPYLLVIGINRFNMTEVFLADENGWQLTTIPPNISTPIFQNEGTTSHRKTLSKLGFSL